jgi:hypothetical protein
MRRMINLETNEGFVEDITHDEMNEWLSNQNFETEEYKTAESEISEL